MLSKVNKLAGFMVSLAVLSILKYLNDNIAETLTQTLQLFIYLSLLFTGGLVVLNLFSLFESLVNAKDTATSRILKSVSEDPSRNFFIGFLITAYLSFIRPILTVNMTFLPYVEWVAIAFGVYLMYSMIGFSNRQFNVPLEKAGWRMHVQGLRRETGRDLPRLTSVMEKFVEHGEKEPLLVSLTLHLQRLGMTEEDILMTLSPLINYQNVPDRKLFFFTLRRTKRKTTTRNREIRQNLLNSLLKKIEGMRSK